MTINRSPELVELIPSIGARIALQNYFRNEHTSEETASYFLPSQQLSLPSTSTPSIMPTVTYKAEEILDITVPEDVTIPITCDAQAPTVVQPLLVEASTVNDTSKVIILNATYDDEPAEKIKRVEIDNVNTTMVCIIVQNLYYNR